jgi:TolA-binding protein
VYYDSRRIDSEGMVFVFRAGAEGVYTLKFNRQDFIRDTLLDDYVQITVKPAPEITGSAWNGAAVAPERIVATPRWPPAAPQSAAPPPPPETGRQEQTSPVQEAPSVSAAEPASAAQPSVELPSAYLAKAKEAYEAGRPADALDILDQYRAAYPGGSDEAYWLYGQALEANSPSRDIRRALDYYRRLVNEYPQSTRYDAARQRIAYLERFFFNIR